VSDSGALERWCRPRQPEDFEALYAGTPAWDIGRPQPPFLELAERHAIVGKVLDVGCGTGEHALMAAALGLEVTGVDAAPTAIETARRKAEERGLAAQFVLGDARDLPALGRRFDTVLDCGLFHVFDDGDRARYEASLRAVVGPAGRCFILCFSEEQPGDYGPRRVRQDEIRETFRNGWRVDSIDDATMDLVTSPDGARAWLAAITRTSPAGTAPDDTSPRPGRARDAG